MASADAASDMHRTALDSQDGISFDNIVNFRDVGRTVNRFMREKKLVEGKLFRSARPDDASLSDRKRLSHEFGIRTIIDLRTNTEHANQAKKRDSDLKIPALIQENEALAEPIKIPGMRYFEININGKGFERSLLWQLSFWSFLKLITLMLFGYRTEAISILGREVMQPRGLVGLGFDSIDHCGPEIAEALRVYSDPSNYPILVHCTQGKDRTGLIIALILLLLSVPVQAADYDYRLSESELECERESRLVEIRSIGLTEEFAGCPPNWLESMQQHLQSKYGGIRQYCRHIGFSKTDEEALSEIIRGEQ